jgi:hypothetical protein
MLHIHQVWLPPCLVSLFVSSFFIYYPFSASQRLIYCIHFAVSEFSVQRISFPYFLIHFVFFTPSTFHIPSLNISGPIYTFTSFLFVSCYFLIFVFSPTIRVLEFIWFFLFVLRFGYFSFDFFIFSRFLFTLFLLSSFYSLLFLFKICLSCVL